MRNRTSRIYAPEPPPPEDDPPWRCPECGDELVAANIDGAIDWHCVDCGGVWTTAELLRLEADRRGEDAEDMAE